MRFVTWVRQPRPEARFQVYCYPDTQPANRMYLQKVSKWGSDSGEREHAVVTPRHA